jgi:hypothetical protein
MLAGVLIDFNVPARFNRLKRCRKFLTARASLDLLSVIRKEHTSLFLKEGSKETLELEQR